MNSAQILSKAEKRPRAFGTMVEHSPQHSMVEGSSPSVDADIGKEISKKRVGKNFLWTLYFYYTISLFESVILSIKPGKKWLYFN